MRNWFYLAMVVVLTAAVVVVWEKSPDILLPDAREPVLQAQLFSIIRQAQAQRFGDEGELSYAFTADELRHFRHQMESVSPEDYTVIEEPRITLYTENPPWHMRASEGLLTDGGTTLTLTDDVHVWQVDKNDPSKNLSELSTDRIVVKPNEKTAQTDAPVTIVTPMGTISAIGMRADLRNQHIEFLSEVQGSYEALP